MKRQTASLLPTGPVGVGAQEVPPADAQPMVLAPQRHYYGAVQPRTLSLVASVTLATAALGGCGEEFQAVNTGGVAGQGAATAGGGSAGVSGAGAGGANSGGTGAVGGGGAAAACRGLKFDGVDDWVQVPDAATLDGIAPLTIEAWILPESYPDEVQILSHHDHAQHTGYVLLIFGGGQMQFRYQFGGQNHTAGFSAVAPAQWHHVAASYDNGIGSLFIDGKAVHSSPMLEGVAADCASPLAIGRAAYADGFPFLGTMDEVRVEGRALLGRLRAREGFVHPRCRYRRALALRREVRTGRPGRDRQTPRDARGGQSARRRRPRARRRAVPLADGPGRRLGRHRGATPLRRPTRRS